MPCGNGFYWLPFCNLVAQTLFQFVAALSGLRAGLLFGQQLAAQLLALLLQAGQLLLELGVVAGLGELRFYALQFSEVLAEASLEVFGAPFGFGGGQLFRSQLPIQVIAQLTERGY